MQQELKFQTKNWTQIPCLNENDTKDCLEDCLTMIGKDNGSSTMMSFYTLHESENHELFQQG